MPHISTLQVVYDAIFLVIMSATMFKELTVWRLWLAVFSLLPVSMPSVCIMYPVGTLHLHHAHSYHIYRSSFYLFCGSHVGSSGTYSHIHISRYSYMHHLTRCHCVFFLHDFTTSGGMFFMAFSTLKALLPVFVNSVCI
jgi:hypothetical protein